MKGASIIKGAMALIFTASTLLSCTTITTQAVDQPSQVPDKYQDPLQQSTLDTIGIESADIHAAVDRVVGRILADPLLSAQDTPPHLLVDAAQFTNEEGRKTNQQFNINLLVELLKTQLQNDAQGRIVLVDNAYDKQPVDSNSTGKGSTPVALRTLGVDYILGGHIGEITNSDGARTERYTQITFHVVDNKTSQIVFSEAYYFRKMNRWSASGSRKLWEF